MAPLHVIRTSKYSVIFSLDLLFQDAPTALRPLEYMIKLSLLFQPPEFRSMSSEKGKHSFLSPRNN